jgi:hypothetical protein
MMHGGKASPNQREYDDYEQDEPTQLQWRTLSPWEYALGDFATLRGLDEDSWIADIGGRRAKRFRTLKAARRALEEAARTDGYEIASSFVEDPDDDLDSDE